MAPARAIAATMLLQTMAGLLLVTLPVLAPSITATANVAASRIGECSGLLFFGTLLPTLLSGPFVRRWGGVRVMQVSLTVGGVGMLLTLFGSWPAILLASIVMGVGYAAPCLQGTVFALYVSYLVEAIGFDLIRAGASFAALQMAGVAARITFGAVSDRWITPQLLLASLSIASVLAVLLLIVIAPSWPMGAVVAVAVFAGATVSGWNGVFMSELA